MANLVLKLTGTVRKRKLVSALAVLAVLLAVGTFVILSRPGRITAENYARIRIGMTRAEVEAILGSPGDHSTVPLVNEERWLSQLEYTIPRRGQMYAAWLGNTAWIEVEYDLSTPEPIVRGCRIESIQPATHSVLEKLFQRAERRWRRWFPGPKIRDG
jgi:hypothetical protein